MSSIFLNARLRGACLAFAAFTLASASSCPVDAHERTVSYSRWSVDAAGRVHAEFRVSDLALSAFAGSVATELLDRDVHVFAGRRPCERVAGFSLAGADRAGWRRYRAAWRCGNSAPPTVGVDLFFTILPAHLHFARVDVAARPSVDRVLTDGDRTWTFPANAGEDGGDSRAGSTSFLEYVAFGIDHIATGYDHLAFVLALLLIAASLAEVAALVTAFTLAHSVTLAAAALGLVRPFESGVEALIGFSIALVAVENAWLLADRSRAVPVAVAAGLAAMGCLAAVGIGNLPVAALLGLGLFAVCHFALLEESSIRGGVRASVAFAFGLVHGFGFAGVLAEMPGGASLPALVGFNLGVETGQLAVVAVAWPLLQIARRAGAGALCSEAGSAAIAGVGLFWFLVRSYG